LLPCDSAGRSLELLCILEDFWKTNRLRSYPLIFLSAVGNSILENIRVLTEYLRKSDSGSSKNLFNFSFVKVVMKRRDLDLFNGPMVVLAPDADLECGAARELFSDWAGDARNKIVFTGYGATGTLQQQLLQTKTSPDKLNSVEISVCKELLLEGDELAAHQNAKHVEAVAAETSRLAKIAQMEVDTDAADLALDAMNMEEVAAELEEKKGWSWEGQNHLRYMHTEPKIEWTDYGIKVGAHEFDQSDEKFGTQPVRQMSQQAAEEQEIDEGPPTKWLNLKKLVEIAAKIEYVDLEGRADGVSVKNIIKAMEPRRIVVVHGSSESTKRFCRDCAKLEFKPFVVAPQINERVDLTSDLNMYNIKLDNSLLSQVQWMSCGNYDVGYITGQLVAEEESDNVQWSLLPTENAPSRSLLHVGQMSLSDFKLKLSAANIHAEFRGTGKLAAGTDGKITVKQTNRKEHGKITLNGKLSKDYFSVREQLYKQYSVL